MSLHVTSHAISRYRERAEPVSYDQAHAVLSSPAVVAAASFGAPFVKLGSGHRVVLCGERIVTVLPKDQSRACLDRRRDHLHGRNA